MKAIYIALASLLLAPLCISVAPASLGGPAAAFAAGSSTASAQKQAALHDTMRKLWEDHVSWTRLYIVSTAAGLPDAGNAAQRLLRNQSDIGDAIKPYYGEAAGNSLSALLKDHINIAADVLAAAKANDAVKLEAANKRWSDNADSLATFLSSANPAYWHEADMRQMLHEHLRLTTDEVKARLAGDWTTDIAAYEQVHEQILMMADKLSAGIIGQFPDKF